MTSLTASIGVPAFAQETQTAHVTITAQGCDPMELTVRAGRVTFVISNKSARALEWEILKGVMVVDERENIAPGFKQKLTTTLEPGEYETACGLLSNPRGKLTVLNASGGLAAEPTKPSASDLIGLAAEHRVWLIGELRALSKAAGAGERETARRSALRLATLKGAAPAPWAGLMAALETPSADLAAPAEAYSQALRGTTLSASAVTRLLADATRDASTLGAADAPDVLAGLRAQAALFAGPARRADAALSARLEERLARLRTDGVDAISANDLSSDLSALSVVLGGN